MLYRQQRNTNATKLLDKKQCMEKAVQIDKGRPGYVDDLFKQKLL